MIDYSESTASITKYERGIYDSIYVVDFWGVKVKEYKGRLSFICPTYTEAELVLEEIGVETWLYTIKTDI